MKTHTIDRTNWPAGPWGTEPDQATWTHPATDFTCTALRRPMGHWCGYVGLPETHPLHGKDPSHPQGADLAVHGGVTFTGQLKDHDPELWWVGFDCAHAYDLSPGYLAQLALLGGFPSSEEQQYRTLAYVERQCHRLAKQLGELT